MTPACDLQEIPGVGPRIAGYLKSVGVQHVADLRGANPEDVYRHMCQRHGRTFDRCLLYVVRCAVYYASTERPRPELLDWWAWKDASGQKRPRSRRDTDTKAKTVVHPASAR